LAGRKILAAMTRHCRKSGIFAHKVLDFLIDSVSAHLSSTNKAHHGHLHIDTLSRSSARNRPTQSPAKSITRRNHEANRRILVAYFLETYQKRMLSATFEAGSGKRVQFLIANTTVRAGERAQESIGREF